MVILGIDTCSNVGSVALMDENKLIGEFNVNTSRTHSQKLMIIIKNMMDACDMKIDDIDAVAVSIGPGSFTGLRIGLATARAICHAKDKKLIGINSLDSLAQNQFHYNGYVMSLMDAQRKNLYGALYSFEGGEISQTVETKIYSLDEAKDLIASMDKKVALVGEGAHMYADEFSEIENAEISSKTHVISKASSLCEIAVERYREGKFDDYYSLVPFYIRKSQAEVDYEKKQKRLSEDGK